jgi:hypothetical protein
VRKQNSPAVVLTGRRCKWSNQLSFTNHAPEREKSTAKGQLPEHRATNRSVTSDIFLWAAVGSVAASLIFQFTGDEEKANFVGHWPPTFLILDLYNKLVKLHGSEGV